MCRSSSRRRVLGVALAGSSAIVLSIGSVDAATRHVTKSGSDAGNLDCTAANPCATMAHAVDIAAPGDTIRLGKGQFAQTAEIVVDKDLTIEGAGQFGTHVVASTPWPPTRIFQIMPGSDVRIASLQMRNGDAGEGAAIYNAGALELEDVWIRRSRAPLDGAVHNLGFLLMQRVEIALTDGHGLTNAPEGTAVVTQSRLGANDGSAIRNNLGVVILRDVLIVANGIKNGAAGFAVDAGTAGGALQLTNVTISGNHGTGLGTAGADVELTHVTITDNEVGIIASDSATVTLSNTIIAGNNTTADCLVGDANVGGAGNLLGETTCVSFPTNVNLYGVPPAIGPLAPNDGGALWTHAPEQGSPAIDGAGAEMCVTPDQRGVSRPIDGDSDGAASCDIGAHEFVPPGPERGRGRDTERGDER